MSTNIMEFSERSITLDSIRLSRWLEEHSPFEFGEGFGRTKTGLYFYLMQQGEYSNGSIRGLELVDPKGPYYEHNSPAWESYDRLMSINLITEYTRIDDVLAGMSALGILEIDFSKDYEIHIWW